MEIEQNFQTPEPTKNSVSESVRLNLIQWITLKIEKATEIGRNELAEPSPTSRSSTEERSAELPGGREGETGDRRVRGSKRVNEQRKDLANRFIDKTTGRWLTCRLQTETGFSFPVKFLFSTLKVYVDRSAPQMLHADKFCPQCISILSLGS